MTDIRCRPAGLRRAALVAVLGLALMGSARGERRPNIVVMLTDDQQWAALGVVQRELGARGRYPWLRTPNMDRIAAEGLRFRNGFVTCSLCSPSRAAILTGRYNHLNGVTDNHTPFPATNLTWSALLRDAGYQTAYFGKFHHGKQRGPRPGFQVNKTYIDQGRYFDCPFEVNGVLQPTSGWIDDVTTDYAVEFLQQPHDRPFAVFIGFKTPHEPTQPPVRARDLYGGGLGGLVPNLTVPAIFRFSAEDRGRCLEARTAIREGRGVPLRMDYFRCIAAVDDDIGRILRALDERRLAEDTVVVFTTDNGFYQGEHCLGDKRSAYDDSMRVPMLVRYPRLAAAGTVRDELVLNIDLAPTLLDLAGLPVPAAMQGQSWRPLLAGKSVSWRTSFLYEYFIEKDYPNTPTLVALRTATAKLTLYPGHDEWTELFDLREDPYEVKNLAGMPAQARLLAAMRAEFECQAAAVGYGVPACADKAVFNPDFPRKRKGQVLP